MANSFILTLNKNKTTYLKSQFINFYILLLQFMKSTRELIFLKNEKKKNYFWELTFISGQIVWQSRKQQYSKGKRNMQATEKIKKKSTQHAWFAKKYSYYKFSTCAIFIEKPFITARLII